MDQEKANQKKLAETQDQILAYKQEIQSLKTSCATTISQMESKFNSRTEKEASLIKKNRDLELEKSDLAEQLA